MFVLVDFVFERQAVESKNQSLAGADFMPGTCRFSAMRQEFID